ncbi:uroporphyrinogen-III synthase [Fulvimarina sp. 2208YS6-2-32]|uniref:Uroporphyrinogen-III synthase n=1 Tax=Fulvimarina uroteuthidis TaxID=3098149 RepID=A0ABU5HZ72_9HYPH|nr:uroporphyrinogen-III synthase [Fulvimarina sp. 2208YS6-2-32]MDY8108424.1 uroporphyrinogen-III synthase [Fulvimarina sp. 2208YS6-2-32]
MTRVLVVREEAAARDTARQLSALGRDPVSCPLEEVVRLRTPVPQTTFDGFVVTSAQAAEALADAFPNDNRICFAVGEATANAVRACGFENVAAGDGRAETLPRLVESAFGHALPGATLLYAAGRNRTGALEAAVTGTSIALRAWEVYDIVRRTPPDREIDALFQGDAIGAVLLLSKAQAMAFADILLPRFEALQPPPRLLCLSARIAEAFPARARELIKISDAPSLVSLFERL